jgi:hypothetical protein
MANGVSLSWMAPFGRHYYAIYLTHFAIISAAPRSGRWIRCCCFPIVAGPLIGVELLVEPVIERRFYYLGTWWHSVFRHSQPNANFSLGREFKKAVKLASLLESAGISGATRQDLALVRTC